MSKSLTDVFLDMFNRLHIRGTSRPQKKPNILGTEEGLNIQSNIYTNIIPLKYNSDNVLKKRKVISFYNFPGVAMTV